MLKLPRGAKIIEISEKNTNSPYQTDPKSIRPEVVDAKVYQVKSAFIKNSVFVTLSFTLLLMYLSAAKVSEDETSSQAS